MGEMVGVARQSRLMIVGLGAVGVILCGSPPRAQAETIDELLNQSPFARERPIVSGLKDQGYGYLDYDLVNVAWNRTCWLFGGAHGASDIAVNDAKSELLELRFTQKEANAIIGIALKVHAQPGIESCP